MPFEKAMDMVRKGEIDDAEIMILASELLRFENVSFGYSESKRVFEEVSLSIRKNDLFLLRGKSGSGKSSFLKLANRFHQANSGEILLNGRNIAEYPIDELRSRLLYLPQLPLMISGSVEENLIFPFFLAVHKNRSFRSDKALEWMEFFQLSTKLGDDAHNLSVGEKQRVALIRALLLEPEILLLDEPTSALDKENRHLIERKIESLVEEGRTTVILVTHQESGLSSPKVRLHHVSRKQVLPLEND